MRRGSVGEDFARSLFGDLFRRQVVPGRAAKNIKQSGVNSIKPAVKRSIEVTPAVPTKGRIR